MEILQKNINEGPDDRTEDEWIKLLFSLAERVLNRYYYGYPLYRDDLIQEGVIQANGLVNQGDFDENRSTLYNYLFTGIRNQMSNFIKKVPAGVQIDLVPEQAAFDLPSVIGEWMDNFECDSPRMTKSNIIAMMEGKLIEYLHLMERRILATCTVIQDLVV